MVEKKNEGNDYQREEIYAETIRAGARRTYFFDVRSTRSNEYFLTLTESKKRYDHDKDEYYYRKHKIFLFKEDFDKFVEGLNNAIDFVRNNCPSENKKEEIKVSEDLKKTSESDISFENLEN